MVIKDKTGGITVSGEDGSVKIWSKSEPGRSITVMPGESARYDNGEWRTTAPATAVASSVDEEPVLVGGKKAGFRINIAE
jgi:hypothetical protein